MHETPAHGPRWTSIVLSLGLVSLVSLAIAGGRSLLLAGMITAAVLPAVVLRKLFPGSRLLWIVFVNLVAVYASVFALFIDEVFASVSGSALCLGFIVPVAAFLLGCSWRREVIARLISNPDLRNQERLVSATVWLVPVAVVGLAVAVLSRLSQPLIDTEVGFLLAMLAIGLIVFAVSRDVAIFLVDAGLLFEEFSARISHLLVPAFAFLTFYSLIVVVFASFYTVVSRYALTAHFRVGLEARPLSFAEALHFSVVTLSTVGYGDIVPVSSLARTLAGAEVVLGVLLLLFGVSEILEYARERRRPKARDREEK